MALARLAEHGVSTFFDITPPEQVEQLLDKYCEAVRDTAMLVSRLERYRCASTCSPETSAPFPHL